MSRASNLAGFTTAIGVPVNLNVGVITATSFSGTASDASGATGDFSIADKIVHTGDTNTAIRFPASDTFTVETGGTEAVRITSGSKVGIGLTNPSDKLHVNGAITAASNVTVGSGAAGGAGSKLWSTGFIELRNDTASINVIRLFSGGYGDVYETFGVSRTGSVTAAGIHIPGGGNLVGIGTTNPLSRLHVSGTHNSHIRMTNTSDDAVDLIGDSNRTSVNSSILAIKGRWNGTDVAKIVFQAATDTTDKDDGNILFHTKDSGSSIAERLRITSGGEVQIANGNLKFSTSGTGIDFSATSDSSGTAHSELLDDYEEGIFSASITMGTSGTVTMNSSYDTLSYTKIGRMVYITGQIRVSSVSSPVGSTLINLPFAVRNNISDARGGGTVTLYINGQAHYYWPLVYQIAESTSQINISANASGYFLPATSNEYAISIMYIVS